MLFNSLDFALFLPIVFGLYWFVFPKNLGLQNFLLVVSSLVFYGWWDWRFLALLLLSALVDYSVGLGLLRQANPRKRKALLYTSLVINLGILGFFKYFNFFVESFAQAFTFLGYAFPSYTLQIILPIGISFYTFQTLSYSIDVYQKKIEPTQDLIAFLAFVSFFPQLVAGPIERATHLLPQFYRARSFDYQEARAGLQQILWGLFKKMVIADNCAVLVDTVFTNPSQYAGAILLLGVFFFAFQIYGDFSGYSDIAIGTAKLFGFQLMQNFNFPYFSRDIAEFWRRWHISLSTWFRDYVYIPLGGSRGGTRQKIINTLLIFVLSGFWHGANFTFIVWGALHAFYFLPLVLKNQNRKHLNIVAAGRFLATWQELLQMIFTFSLVVFAWVFFRAKNLDQAFEYFYTIIFHAWWINEQSILVSRKTILLIFVFILIEWWGREKSFALAKIDIFKNRFIRWLIYYAIILAIFYFTGKQQSFIYFQF
jgi:D-alanyl-lipoteichoic acid acyltransferase DltB (MBOAT superfamily)